MAVNGTNPDYDLTNQHKITLALAQNGGLKRIEDTMRQRLDEAGWSQNVKEYATKLFRSGEATTFDDAYGAILKQININGEGHARAPGAPDLRIPRDAKVGGAEALKKEVLPLVKGGGNAGAAAGKK